LNGHFEKKLADSSLYRGIRFSFLKIFQHALTYEQAGADNRILKNYLHLPVFIQQALLSIKALRRKDQKRISLREIVFMDPARIVSDENGQWHSVYMEQAVRLFDRKYVSVLSRKREPKVHYDASIEDIPKIHGFPDRVELEMLFDINTVVRKVLNNQTLTNKERSHILSALHVFYEDFRFYYSLFKEQPVRSVVFISHYHNEGLIAALNVLNIRSIELQHGLISGNDLYYQYSPTFKTGTKDAFFPDAICVFGNYWKEQLLKGCEFESSQIIVAGDYQWQPENLSSQTQKLNQVIICAQKNMHEEYIAYARMLKPLMLKHPEWKWIIKIHPLEKLKDSYFELANEGYEIVDREKSISVLLRESRIQISIYSTTFFDALGCDIVNFSLQSYSVYSDYAAQMVVEGVAQPLQVHEDPIEKFLLSKEPSNLLLRDEVYSPLNKTILRKAILGE
jgi:hypothetical protein